MNTQTKTRRTLNASLLGVFFVASISSASVAHASGISGTVARIQNSVNALHTGVARTMSKIDELRNTLKDLPEAQRELIQKKFKEMNDPSKRRERVEKMMDTVDGISEPVKNYVAQLMTKMHGKLADRMRSELVDGQPGPIGAAFGMLYDMTNPLQQALLDGGSQNGTRSINGRNNEYPNHYNRGLLEDPQTMDDCIAHKSNRDEPSRADGRCVIRLLTKPVGKALCGEAELFGKAVDAALPSDITSWYVKTAGMAVPLTIQSVCLISQVAAGVRDALKVDDELRFKIESNLMGDKPLAMFKLPGQFGGKLEVVERVVYDTIQSAKDAGFNLGNAEAEYAAGGDSFSSKQYAAAYTHFATAYQAIVNSN